MDHLVSSEMNSNWPFVLHSRYCLCLVAIKRAPIEQWKWEQRNMFGARTKIMREEQLVNPPIPYLTCVFVPLSSVLNKPVNPESLALIYHIGSSLIIILYLTKGFVQTCSQLSSKISKTLLTPLLESIVFRYHSTPNGIYCPPLFKCALDSFGCNKFKCWEMIAYSILVSQ